MPVQPFGRVHQVNCDYFSTRERGPSGDVPPRLNLQLRDAGGTPLVCFTENKTTELVVIPILCIFFILTWVTWVVMSAMKHVNEPRSFSHRAAPHAWYASAKRAPACRNPET